MELYPACSATPAFAPARASDMWWCDNMTAKGPLHLNDSDYFELVSIHFHFPHIEGMNFATVKNPHTWNKISKTSKKKKHESGRFNRRLKSEDSRSQVCLRRDWQAVWTLRGPGLGSGLEAMRFLLTCGQNRLRDHQCAFHWKWTRVKWSRQLLGFSSAVVLQLRRRCNYAQSHSYGW